MAVCAFVGVRMCRKCSTCVPRQCCGQCCYFPKVLCGGTLCATIRCKQAKSKERETHVAQSLLCSINWQQCRRTINGQHCSGINNGQQCGTLTTGNSAARTGNSAAQRATVRRINNGTHLTHLGITLGTPLYASQPSTGHLCTPPSHQRDTFSTLGTPSAGHI